MFTLNFWILDDIADVFQCLGTGFLDSDVGVSEDLCDLRNDTGQARRQLLRGTVCHRSQQLHSTCIRKTTLEIVYILSSFSNGTAAAWFAESVQH